MLCNAVSLSCCSYVNPVTPSCCIRPDLYSVNGSHDPSALTSESDFLWHTSSGWLLRWAYWWGLVVPKEKRVIHLFYTQHQDVKIFKWCTSDNFFLFLSNYLSLSLRVVTEECYPFSPTQQSPEVARCMMQSRAVGRGKRQAIAHCPNSHSHSHNDIYQSTPPYRLSSNVSQLTPRIKQKISFF